MDDVIFIGDQGDAEAFQNAGIPSYAPPLGLLVERVLAETGRCRVLAMTEGTFAALPGPLARALREGRWPQITVLPELHGMQDRARLRDLLRRTLAQRPAARA